MNSLWCGILPLLACTSSAWASPPTPTAQVQLWATAWDQDQNIQADTATYGDPEHDLGLSLQRARIGVRGELDGLDYELRFGPEIPYDALSGGDAQVGVVDAIVGWSGTFGPGVLRLSAGTEKVPYSRDELISSSDLLFQERAVGTAWLTPGRDLGLLADYRLNNGLRLRAGAFNGNGSLLGDANNGEMAALRLEWGKGDGYRTATQERAFHLAISGLQDRDLATTTTGLSADMLLRLGGLSLLAEVNQREVSPDQTDVSTPDVFNPIVQRSATAQLSYFAPLGATSLEPAVRLAVMDDAQGRADNGDVGVVHAGLTWHRGALDLGAGWIHRIEFQGEPWANDTARLWLQVVTPAPLAPPATIPLAWNQSYAGTWQSKGVLAGGELTLWPEGERLDGHFRMTRPVGRVEVGRQYELETLDRDAEGQILVKVDPHGDGTDVVWFELSPDAENQLCGWGYEDGKRDDTVRGQGGGAWVCWSKD